MCCPTSCNLPHTPLILSKNTSIGCLCCVPDCSLSIVFVVAIRGLLGFVFRVRVCFFVSHDNPNAVAAVLLLLAWAFGVLKPGSPMGLPWGSDRARAEALSALLFASPRRSRASSCILGGGGGVCCLRPPDRSDILARPSNRHAVRAGVPEARVSHGPHVALRRRSAALHLGTGETVTGAAPTLPYPALPCPALPRRAICKGRTVMMFATATICRLVRYVLHKQYWPCGPRFKHSLHFESCTVYIYIYFLYSVCGYRQRVLTPPSALLRLNASVREY